MTFPFHPPDTEASLLPNPAGRFRTLPVPLPLLDFLKLLAVTSMPLLPVALDQVLIGGRHATQYAHCRRTSGPRSQSIIRYGSATRARNWSTKRATTATVWTIEQLLPFLVEFKGMAFVVGLSSLGPLFSDLGGDGRMEDGEVGDIFGQGEFQPRWMRLEVGGVSISLTLSNCDPP